MEIQTIIAIITALGVGSGITEAIRRLSERRRTKADVTAVLSRASSDLVQQYVDTNVSLRNDLAGVKKALGEVEDKLDHILDVVAEEKRWARVNGHHDAPILHLIQPPVA